MMKTTKIRLSGLMIALTLLLLLPLSVRAADGGVFRFTHNPQENITFTLENGALTVANLPNTAAFSTVCVRVNTTGENTQLEEVLARKADGSVNVSLLGLKDGAYYLELFFSQGGNAYASYILGDDLRFRWQNGAGVFAEPPALAHNSTAFAAGRKDIAALAHYLSPSRSIQSADVAIVKLAREITAGMEGEYHKMLAIHDWVCANLWFDFDAVERGSDTARDALGALNNRRAVCEGYANLIAALLRASDIPAKTVHGYGLSSDISGGWTKSRLSGAEANHIWTEAYIEGRWVIIDATWDCGNEYRGGRTATNGGIYSHRYFDATLEAFSADHLIGDYEDSDIALPDAPSSWAAGQTGDAISAELVPLVLRVKYTHSITRAEFCALAAALYERLAGEPISGRAAFADTLDINVEKMAAIGVVTGIGNNLFAPHNRLTREQAAVMLTRLADALGKPLPEQASLFVDSAQLSLWAAGSVGQVQAAGVMNGVGNNTFAPRNPYTREQSIVTIMRLWDFLR